MPTFFFFCHRFFELRFVVATGILDNLTKHGTVCLMLPESLAQSFAPLLDNNKSIRIIHSRYDKIPGWRRFALNFFGDILYLTFPNTNDCPNATAEFHRQHYYSKSKFKTYFTIGFSRIASKFSPLLKMVVFLYQSFLPSIHDDLLNKEKPDLMIGCSFGLSIEDAAFLYEAKRNGITSAVLVQSWDRTSNKGYPTVHPDHALVWNNIMKREAVINLNFDENHVRVIGSPLWDTHFKTLERSHDPDWRKNLGIKDSTKVLFYACGGFGNHPANMTVIPKVFDLAKEQPFNDKIHIVFRLYPHYLSPVTQSGEGKKKRNEIEKLLAQYQDEENITILYPDLKFDGKNFVPSAEDHHFMTECLYQCDISLSQVSSQMIEACIFDKPSINIEFGRRVTDKYDLEIKDYKTEHLLRIYRTNAIYRVQTKEALIPTIALALKNPKERQKQRETLVQQEAPVYRGQSSEEAAKLLATLI